MAALAIDVRAVPSGLTAYSHLPTIIYFLLAYQMPDRGDDEPWVIVEASDDGRPFESGAA